MKNKNKPIETIRWGPKMKERKKERERRKKKKKEKNCEKQVFLTYFSPNVEMFTLPLISTQHSATLKCGFLLVFQSRLRTLPSTSSNTY